MKLVPLEGLPRLHATPLPETRIWDGRVAIEVDSEGEERLRLLFSPFQAARVTTADCFLVPGGSPLSPGRIYEVVGSVWIEELKTALRKIDCDATFLSSSRHFLVPAQDDFIEVVSWSIHCEPAPIS